jgi:hypothetical protein
MTLKTLFYWIALTAIIIASTVACKLFVGPVPFGIGILITIVIATSILPIAYLTQDWNFIQTTREGRFGDVYPPINGVISFKSGMYDNVDIKQFDIRLAYLGRWVIYSKKDSSLTFFHDRLTKNWYYNYHNQEIEKSYQALIRTKLG